MPDEHYLFFFDPAPIPQTLMDYFNQFNTRIIQRRDLSRINNLEETPWALLIHWSLLKKQPETLRQLYQQFTVPLIVIQENSDEDGCVNALEIGADDVLIHPLHPRELHARINAIRRRVLSVQSTADKGKEVILFANWRLYPASRQVFNEQRQELTLSPGEYELLLAFVQHPQQVLSREFLLERTKSSHSDHPARAIDVQISRLRQKISPENTEQKLIKTIRNGGYLLTSQVLFLKESDLE